MKGPGLRIEIDVRREWCCPTCGQHQRWSTEITAPFCFCVRNGVPMMLVEGRRPGRLDLRPELRSVLDRIQGGEEIPRLIPLVSGESEVGAFGGGKPRGRQPRPERINERSSEPPPEKVKRLQEPETPAPTKRAVTTEGSSPLARMQTPEEDEFGAGLGGETAAPKSP